MVGAESTLIDEVLLLLEQLHASPPIFFEAMVNTLNPTKNTRSMASRCTCVSSVPREREVEGGRGPPQQGKHTRL